jgi:hypothetical protein
VELRTKCQLAELIDDAITSHGLKPRTLPLAWMLAVIGPWFERTVPLRAQRRREWQVGAVALALLLPFLTVALVLALPFEWLRSRRATRHNAKMRQLLAGARGGVEGQTPSALAAAADATAALSAARAADRLVAINYRVDDGARPAFFGVALASFRGQGQQLVSWTAHRALPPPDAPDGGTVLAALAPASTCPAEQVHWEWGRRNPYELTEHPARPW